MSESATVLIVDDETAVVDLFAAFLADRYTVKTATGGQAALEQYDASVDAVLLDRRMPDLAGDEVLQELRAQHPETPIAMLTAVEPNVDIVEMPFDDYLTKPIDQDELIKRVDVLLDRATHNEQSREFFALAAKKTALETADKQSSDEYQRLTDRMADLREAINGTLDHHLR